MLYIIYVVTTRIPLCMKILECGSMEPKHVGELREQVYHRFP